MADERDNSNGIQLQIDERTAMGRYANLALVNHSENEFVLDFAFLQPGSPEAKVISRLISSPRHTKRFLKALQRNLERYEDRFGEIPITDEPPLH
jgi:hypothetical protein